MAKVLKVLVLVILVLSVVSLALGVVLFTRRTTLKGRTQRLEAAVADVARNLHLETFDAERVKRFEEMEAPLRELAVAAQNKFEEAESLRQDLDKTRADLARTQQERDEARQEAETLRGDLDAARGELERKSIELVRAQSRAQQLEQDKARLQTEVESLNTKLVQAEEEIRDLQDQVATRDNTIQDLMAKYGETPMNVALKGLTGRVLLVNPYWNFVVIDVGGRAGLAPNAEMLVHREDKLVGRIRLTNVTPSLSVGEVLTEWEVSPIREGDYVLY